jgi:predicted HAD superfamily phosphohydrolase YqeG
MTPPEGQLPLLEEFSRERRALHLSMRLLTRTYLALNPARRSMRRDGLVALWSAGVATDVAIAAWMRRSNRDGLGWRIPLDVLDISLWGLAAPGTRFSSGNTILGVPAAAEAAFFRGPLRGGARLLLEGAAVAGLARRAGRSVSIKILRWPAVAGLCGALMRGYADRHLTLKQSDHLRLREAHEEYAYLVGQNRVITGTDTAADWLGGRAIELSVDSPLRTEITALRSVRYEIAQRQQSSNDVLLLATALARWETNHNTPAGAPGISLLHQVRLHVAQPDALTPLLGDQVARLEAALSSIAYRIPGPVVEIAVSVDNRGGHRLGAQVELLVNRESVTIPAAADRQMLRSFDPASIAFLLEASQLLEEMSDSGPRTPRRIGVPIILLDALVAWVIHDRAEGRPISPDAQLALTITTQAIRTVLVTRTMRNAWKSDGSQIFPAAGAAMFPALMLALKWDEFSAFARWAGAIGGATITLTGYFQRPVPRRPRDFLLDLLTWPTAGLAPIRTVRSANRAYDQRLGEQFALERQTARAHAELRGMRDWAERTQTLHRALTLELDTKNRSGDEATLYARRRADASAALEKVREEINYRESLLDGLDFAVADAQKPARRRTPVHQAHDLSGALGLAATLSDSVVVDIENCLVSYQATSDQREEAIEQAIDIALAHREIRTMFFITNGRLPVIVAPRDGLRLWGIHRGRKPWIWIPPLARHRTELWGAAVCGDQLLTDGLLAHYLHGTFIEVRQPISADMHEPLWPRLLRRLGESFAAPAFENVQTV